MEVKIMITITIYGLDQYIVGHLSKDLTPNLAKLCEVNEDDINFVAPDNMVFHMGVEQTSWNVLVKVNAPKKIHVLQDDIANVISVGIGESAINLAIEFYYYSSDDRYERINKDYPRFITESNLVNVENEEDNDDDYQGDDIEGDGEEIYDGDIFEEFNKTHHDD